MTRGEAVASGNTFVVTALTILLLIQHLVLAVPQRQRQINQLVGESSQIAREASRLVQSEMMCAGTNYESRVCGRFLESSNTQLESSNTQSESESIANERRLTTEFLSLKKSELDIENLRIVRELKIPGTDLTFDESEVKIFYPIVFIGVLLGILSYRSRILRIKRMPGDEPAPFWAAPFSIEEYSRKWLPWVTANALGFSLIAYLLRSVWLFAVRDEFYASPYIAAATVALGSIVLAPYGLALWSIWKADI